MVPCSQGLRDPSSTLPKEGPSHKVEVSNSTPLLEEAGRKLRNEREGEREGARERERESKRERERERGENMCVSGDALAAQEGPEFLCPRWSHSPFPS